MVLGYWREGVRLLQWPLVFTFAVQQMIFMLTRLYLNWIFVCGFSVSFALAIKFGQGDYSNFKPSGPFRVGYKEFTSKDLENDCSVFYPAVEDGSGKFGAPFLIYAKD